MANSILRTGNVGWLSSLGKNITLHIENSCDVLVFSATHNFYGVFHSTGNGTITEIDLLPPTYLTITKTQNTVNISCPDNFVMNFVFRHGDAYLVN